MFTKEHKYWTRIIISVIINKEKLSSIYITMEMVIKDQVEKISFRIKPPSVASMLSNPMALSPHISFSNRISLSKVATRLLVTQLIAQPPLQLQDIWFFGQWDADYVPVKSFPFLFTRTKSTQKGPCLFPSSFLPGLWLL